MAQVLMHGGTPTNDETWSYSGTIASTVSYAIAVKAAFVSASGTKAYMFNSPTLGNSAAPNFRVGGTENGTTAYYYNGDNYSDSTIGMSAGTQPYFYQSEPNPIVIGGVTVPGSWTVWTPYTGTAQADFRQSQSPGVTSLVGTAMKWRTLGWSGAIPEYALYSPDLSNSQRNAVAFYMVGTVGSAVSALAIPYLGDLPEYPLISITGPIANPIVTNTTTGEKLDFSGVTLNAGTTYVIDTRYGYKTVTEGTVNRIDKLTDDSSLATWHIAPNPVATGGTNLIGIAGVSNGTATRIQVVYFNRYMSF